MGFSARALIAGPGPQFTAGDPAPDRETAILSLCRYKFHSTFPALKNIVDTRNTANDLL